jgi:hypothetical protein
MRIISLRRVSLCVLMMLGAVGCRAGGHDADARTSRVIVQATTQPMDDVRAAEGTNAESPRRVEVTVRDSTRAGAGAAARTLVGHAVRVQFRRDALGMATPAPLPANSDFSGGRAVTVSGKVVMAADGWVVLEADGRTYWVAQPAILLIEVRD